MTIHESGENYLETILMIENEQGYARSIDVANRLNITKPSVSRAVSILKESGYLTMDDDGWLCLTETGRAKAETIYMRHRVLTNMLIKLGVSPATATDDACRIEHDISDESFEKIRKFVK